jgi:hypothetical protein
LAAAARAAAEIQDLLLHQTARPLLTQAAAAAALRQARRSARAVQAAQALSSFCIEEPT